MSERFILDRIEDGVAVLERPDRTTLELPAPLLPPGTREGDALVREKGVLKRADNAADHERIRRRFDGLIRGNREG